MKRIGRKGWILTMLFALTTTLVAASVVVAAGAQVTVGDLHTFADGPGLGYDITGRAQMVRTADGRTLVSVHAQGLFPNTDYAVHVHNAPCAVNNGGGHYQHEVGGDVDDANEIWPGFTTNAAGHGSGKAVNDFTAGPEAQSVVVHHPGGPRIACADLQ
jgi:hypothetical protein